MSTLPVIDRFLDKVDFSGCAAGETCWNWTACVNGYGYAVLRVKGYSGAQASRTAWRLFNGEIPEGMLVCHRCDNARCVNPEHLFLGTVQDNNRDMYSKGRHIFGVTSPKSKLNDEKVREIRRKYIRGVRGYHRLGREYGVSYDTISKIIKGYTWKHVS